MNSPTESEKGWALCAVDEWGQLHILATWSERQKAFDDSFKEAIGPEGEDTWTEPEPMWVLLEGQEGCSPFAMQGECYHFTDHPDNPGFYVWEGVLKFKNLSTPIDGDDWIPELVGMWREANEFELQYWEPTEAFRKRYQEAYREVNESG